MGAQDYIQPSNPTPYRMSSGGGGQDRDFSTGLPALTLPGKALSTGGGGQEFTFFDDRNTPDYRLRMARGRIIYENDWTDAVALRDEVNAGTLSKEKFLQYMSKESINTEIERIRNYPKYDGSRFSRFMQHLGDYVPMITTAALTWMFGQAFAGGESSVTGAETSVAASETASTVVATEQSVETFTQLENFFQETGSMDFTDFVGSENALPYGGIDPFSFDSSVLTPDTFVDNWDMLQDPTVVYQAPEVLQFENPMPGFLEKLGNKAFDTVVNKGFNAVLGELFNSNQGPIAQAPSNPIANRTPSRESAAALRNPLNDYYQQVTGGGSNIIVILAVLLLVTLGISALGRR